MDLFSEDVNTQFPPSTPGPPLPILHVYLALKASVPVVVVAAIMQPNGIYRLLISDPIAMRSYADRHAEIVNNAERVLEVTADFIRR